MRVNVEYHGEAFTGTYNPETQEIHAWRDLDGGGRMVIHASGCNHSGNGKALRITPAPSAWERFVARLRRLA